MAAAFGRLPHARRTDPAAVAERHRDKEVLRARLAELCEARPEVAAAVDAEIEALNADPDALDELLSRQNYRLAYWRTAARSSTTGGSSTSRRWSACGSRTSRVFADTHRAHPASSSPTGSVDGLRVDHVDGLADPEGYLDRLREATGGALRRGGEDPGTPTRSCPGRGRSPGPPATTS